MNQNFHSVSFLKQTFYMLSIFQVDFNIASELESRCLQRISFRWKSVFRKSNFVEKLALKDTFIWSIYTIKASKLAFCAVLENLLRKKIISFRKKWNWIKLFENNRFLKHFLSCFESRKSNASDLEPFFYNSTISNRKF